MDYIHWNPIEHAWVCSVVDLPYSSLHEYVRRVSIRPIGVLRNLAALKPGSDATDAFTSFITSYTSSSQARILDPGGYELKGLSHMRNWETHTGSNPRILSRSQAETDAKELIDKASPLLEELVNYSSHVYLRCLFAGNTAYEDLPAFVLYEHIIEMTDGIEVLIQHSCCEPAVPLLRSSFEAFISLRYLFQEDYERRSLCWLYCDYSEEKRRQKQLDRISQQGQELRQALNWELPGFQMPKLSAEQLKCVRNSKMNGPFGEIEKEYKRRKKEIHHRPSWFSLFGGPSNLQKLAKKVKLENVYITSYRRWSCAAHSADSSRYVQRVADGKSVGHQLRFAENLLHYSSLGGFFVWAATDAMVTKFRPVEPNHVKWSSEIKERLVVLSETPVNVTERRT